MTRARKGSGLMVEGGAQFWLSSTIEATQMCPKIPSNANHQMEGPALDTTQVS